MDHHRPTVIRPIGMGGGAALSLAALLLFGIVGTPDTVRWCAIAALACLAVLWFCVTLARGRPLSFRPATVPAVMVLAWAWASLSWSGDWKQGLVHAVNMTGLFIVYLAVSNVSRETLRAWVPKVAAVALIGAMVLQWDMPQSTGGFGNDNWQTEFLLLILPFAFALACTVGTSSLLMAMGATWLVVGVTVYLFTPGGSYVKWLVLFAALVLMVAAVYRKPHLRRFRLILGLLLANGAIWALVVEPGMIARKLTQRAELLVNTLAMWADSPIIGQGLGSFNHEYGRFAEWHLTLFPGMDTFMRPMHVFAGQTHNDWVQLLAELGLVGFGLAAWFIWRTWRARPSWDGLDWAAAWSLGAAFIVGCVAFPLQNPATALLVTVALAILTQGPATSISFSRWLYPLPGLASLAAAAGVVWMATGTFYAHAAFSWTRELIEKEPVQALGANMLAIKWWPYEAHERLQLAMSLANLLARFGSCESEPDLSKTCIKLTDGAADQINKISRSAAPYAPPVLLSRIQYLLYAGRQDRDRAEIESSLAFLKEHASLQATTWLMEAQWAGLIGDAPRVAEAVRRGYPMAKDPEAYYREQFEKLAGMLQYEESRP